MISDEQKKRLEEIATGCETLESYHNAVAAGYKEIKNYLRDLDTNKVDKFKDVKDLNHVLILPITEIFKQLDAVKKDSPDDIFGLIRLAYISHKEELESFKETDSKLTLSED